MKAFKIVTAFFIILPMLYSCTGPGQNNLSTRNRKGNIMVLDDFEKKPGQIKWEGSVSLSEKFPAHGKSCCKLDTTGGAPLRLETRNCLKNGVHLNI